MTSFTHTDQHVVGSVAAQWLMTRGESVICVSKRKITGVRKKGKTCWINVQTKRLVCPCVWNLTHAHPGPSVLRHKWTLESLGASSGATGSWCHYSLGVLYCAKRLLITHFLLHFLKVFFKEPAIRKTQSVPRNAESLLVAGNLENWIHISKFMCASLWL